MNYNQRDFIIEELDSRICSGSLTFELIKKRLPVKDWLVVADITIALDLPDPSAVYAWIDAGEFESFNAGSNPDGKNFYKISREVFLEFAKNRLIEGRTRK